MSSAVDRNTLVYWVLFALNLPCLCVLVLWAVIGIFSLHIGWESVFANLILIALAFLAIRNAFHAHVEKSWGQVKIASRMLAVSIMTTCAVLAVFLYLVMVPR